MKRFVVIWMVKLLYFAGNLLGKGTSLPGGIALKICPDILKRLKLPKLVVAVTGSNGKTTTVEIIARTLEKNGLRVAWNEGGSNQIEGVTTLLCRRANAKGEVQADVCILESDERYARHTFSYFTPTHFVVTNLFRDQMTRNAHPKWIADLIGEAISEKTTLVLNADDPLVAKFGKDRPGTVYFGMAENAESTKEPVGCYQDHAFCPVCGQRMEYEYYQFAGLGKYSCFGCSFVTPPADVLVTDYDPAQETIEINGTDRIRLAFGGRYFIYNLCAAYAVCQLAGISGKQAASDLSELVQKNGRVAAFEVAGREGMLLTAKHENSVSYDQSLEYVSRQDEDMTVCILVDAISRKYFTGEISWLWDVHFEKLNTPRVKKVLLCGRYAFDLATRFSFTGISEEKIEVIPSLEEMGRRFYAEDGTKLYVITCFSDKDKIYSRVHALGATAK